MCSAGLLLKSTPVEVSKGHRPHTRLQQKCFDLAETLPPLSEAQRKWARGKMDGLGYLVKRGRGGRHTCVWCQECGLMDETDVSQLAVSIGAEGTGTHVCSRCGMKLQVKNWVPRWYDRKVAELDFYFAIVTTCGGMQVTRVFNWHQSNSMGSDTVNHIFEAYQVWFEPGKCKQVVLSKPYTRNWYSCRWSMYGEFKVKRGVSCDSFFTLDLYVYPRAKILPVIRRNGWSNTMFRMKTDHVSLWRGLLTDPAIEGLAKTRQYDVIDYWFQTGGVRKDKSQWLPVVRICNRKKYIIRDASMWFDYIDLLKFFHKDIHNSFYVCPADLKREHDRLLEKKRRMEKAEELKRNIAQAKKYERQYEKHRGIFFGIRIGNDDIDVSVIESVREMAEEGTMMHHCVYTNRYYDHARHPYSLILSARNKDGHRLETVEVSTKTWKVVQSRGVCNGKTEYHDDIVKLVEKNIHLYRKAAIKTAAAAK